MTASGRDAELYIATHIPTFAIQQAITVALAVDLSPKSWATAHTMVLYQVTLPPLCSE